MPATLPNAAAPNTQAHARVRSAALRARFIDHLAFSNALPAAIAAALTLVACRAFDSPEVTAWCVIAAGGAVLVYGLDRLRDRDRDRATFPRRTAFVDRHAPLVWTTVFMGVALVASGLTRATPRIVALCAAVGVVGLLHRRLKHLAAVKVIYVCLAWTTVTAGIPFVSAGRGPIAWIGAVYLASFAANLIASNLRDEQNQRLRSHPGLVLARLCAAMGLMLTLLGPPTLRPLAWIPGAELLALAVFRPTEHYRHLAVDGALLTGALATLIQQSLA